MYSLRAYGDMIGDSARFEPYARAIAAVIRPGDVVCEIGCGPGLFSMLACRAGARRVYAIETDDIADTARQIIAANGFADRITLIQRDSRKTELPERANVIVSDIRGVLPLHGRAIETLQDARKRFLAPGGVMIPRRDVLKAAILRADKYYGSITRPWTGCATETKLDIPLHMILNSFHIVGARAEDLMTDAQQFAVVDYLSDSSLDVEAAFIFRAGKSGEAHGICVWFETELFEDVGFSSGPGAPVTIYGQLFLPWLEEVTLREGQEIQVGLKAALVGDEYIWCWQTDIIPRDAKPRIRFIQSTFEGAHVSSQTLRRHATDFVPTLDENGQAERFLLEAMDGKLKLEEIAEQASLKFPEVYPQPSDAFERVAEFARKFSR
jgi:protein arginine N-methyltransferase 1